MRTVLDSIVARKREEIAASGARRDIHDLRRAAEAAEPPRDFLGALRSAPGVALIAEIKKASPSAGLIRDDFDPVEIAGLYAGAGASCLSVLTDEEFFRGHLDYLTAVREAVTLPVLRKDFLLDESQIYEARAAGADAVLLIAECLEDDALGRLFTLATSLGMTPLVELYELANLERVLALQPSLVGVNNRDLRTFETDLHHTIHLAQRIGPEVLLVSESGIRTRQDVHRLEQAGCQAILVGEALMRAPDIAAGVRDLLGEGPEAP